MPVLVSVYIGSLFFPLPTPLLMTLKLTIFPFCTSRGHAAKVRHTTLIKGTCALMYRGSTHHTHTPRGEMTCFVIDTSRKTKYLLLF